MRSALLAFVAATIAIRLAGPLERHAADDRQLEQAKTAKSPPVHAATPVVVELFTSEGCSDCPPADQLLYSLEQTQPVDGAEIIPLEQHVDYWDSEGWRDPFSSQQFTLRQRDYVYAFNLQSAYTPQMVVDGAAQFVGSDRNRALAAILKAKLLPKANLQIESLSDSNLATPNLPLRIMLEPPANPQYRRGADILLAITEDYLASNVTRGENAGVHMKHLGVVRELRVLGRVDSAGAFSAAPDVTLAKSWKRENLHVVAFVQDRATRQILAASTLPLRGSRD